MWKKCFFWSFVAVLVCGVAVIAKDEGSCISCVHRDQCVYFGQMSRAEQDRWLEKFTCKAGSMADDEASLFGFAPLSKRDFICCPNFGGAQGSPYEHDRSLDKNQTQSADSRGQNKNSDDDTGAEIDPSKRPIYFNYGTRPQQSRPIQNNQRPWNSQQPNQWSNQQPSQSSWTNQLPSQHSWNNKRPNNYQSANQNWNQRPAQQRPSLNQNPNQSIQYSNNVRNPNDRSDGSFGGSQENFDGGNTGNFGTSHGGSNGGNFIENRGGQCSRVTSLPPSPDTGCCGRDPSDADRITGNPSNRTPSKFNPRPWAPEASEDEEDDLFHLPSWLQSAFPFKEKQKRATVEPANVTVTLENRITGGKMTEIDQFPWTVLLKTTFNYGNKESSFACGGSLISSNYVLTAAHCMKDEGATVSDVEITLAEFDKRSFPRDCVSVPGEGRRCIDNVVMHAADVITHPHYDDQRLQNDIALIRLRGNAPYTEFIRPICLPPIDIDSPDFSDLPLAVAGWGRDGRYTSEVKQSTVVNLVPQGQCKKNYPFLTRRHLCAAGYTGEDTCKGDSGGPLMILYSGKYFVVGVVSGKRADSPCGSAVPSLYTNVYQYLDWIMTNIRQ